MLSVCKQLFGAWNNIGIRYCHWKSNEHLLEGLQGETDLDIFVAPQDKDICEQSLRDYNYIILKPQNSSLYPLVDEWIGFDQETGKMVHVHLHYRIITGTKFCKEYQFPLDDIMLNTRIINPLYQVYVAAPEIEIIVLYSRIVLKAKSRHKISTKGYEPEIVYLHNNVDFNKVHDYCFAFLGDKDGEILYSNIVKNNLSDIDWTEIYRIVYRWLKDSRNRSIVSCWFRTRYYWFRCYYDIILNKLGATILNKKVLPSKGLSIAFIGQDGSGKSTITKDIYKWLDWKVSSHIFYLGTGDGYNSTLKYLLKSANKINSSKQQIHPDSTERQSKLKSKQQNRGFKRSIGTILTCLHLINATSSAFKKVCQAQRYIKKGGVALFDRYPQCQFFGIYDGPKIRSLYSGYTGIMGRFINYCATREEENIKKISAVSPDIVFKLVLSPEESIRRKPFENYELVKQKYEITDALSYPESQVFVIDATQDYAIELLTIKKYLWESFQKLQY